MNLTTIGARCAAGVAVVATVTAGIASGAHAARDDNWHVHDGIDAPVPPGLADVLAGNRDGTLTPAERTAYLTDPLRCPDATDKGLLPTGRQPEQPLRTGVCFTDAYVVHLRTVSVDTVTPPSWSELPNHEFIGGVEWKTVYLLTGLG